MSKYVTRRARGFWPDDLECEVAAGTTITVVESDDEPQPTGLLDQHGNELYRICGSRPIGFAIKGARK